MVVSNIFYFHPYLGKWSNWTNIFQIGWSHQLVIYCSIINIQPQPQGRDVPLISILYKQGYNTSYPFTRSMLRVITPFTSSRDPYCSSTGSPDTLNIFELSILQTLIFFVDNHGVVQTVFDYVEVMSTNGPTMNTWAMKKPWLVRVYRGLYYPIMWGF